MSASFPIQRFDELDQPAVQPYALSSATWAIAFLWAGFALQMGRFFFGSIGVVRLPMRIGMYAISIFLLVLIRTRGPAHPAARWVLFAIVILGIEFIHPGGGTPVARIAQCALYIAVLAPCLWATRLRIDHRAFTIILRTLWGFYVLSALFGVLQVRYPGQYEGDISATLDNTTVAAHTFVLADGSKVVAPRGLTDNPGGAGVAGVYSVVLGIGLLLTERSTVLRIAVVGGMIAGIFCIYLCQGRTNIIIILFDALVVLAILIRRGAVGRAAFLTTVLAVVAIVGTSVAFSVGGKSTVDRFMTLLAADPSSVYQANRGQFLDELIYNDLLVYPLGAGEGRWGLMAAYFSDPANALWAEMQWQALDYDGGIPLVLIYLAIFGTMTFTAYRIARTAVSSDLGCWAAVVVGYTVAAFVASFAFPLMCMQLGIELVLLNACLYACYAQSSSVAAALPYGSND